VKQQHQAIESSRIYETPDVLASYAVGCAFGRWDIRFATGERQRPELPEPFATLPVCPSGQLQNEQGLPMTKEDVQAAEAAGHWRYPVDIPWDGILVDDPGHSLDFATRVRAVLKNIWRKQAESVEQEALHILNVRSLREYFAKPAGFFADHLGRYSDSRRQAPIYWALATPSGSYTLWVYYPRLTTQTLHTCLADFLDPKLKSLSIQIQNVRSANGSESQLGQLLDFQDELKDIRAEIEQIIRLPYVPNPNDGVLVTASPLWKLFRLPKWQKDLKTCWDALSRGDYDWAHLAYSIRRDQVQEKCKADRALAIAHGIEHVCLTQAPKAEKEQKRTATRVKEDAI
jgi:hypothetical protein